ncbi:hypothetical protein EYF80_029151 [Liparis tanakae]|uniref:Uncharacterized protein n=1 Tax=Liparis tanakae TaxID=230148 RepID=A0A4Z2H4A4_9TELE|nr:hypothetical protein EYF80_029151 [Liparis tanakae]
MASLWALVSERPLDSRSIGGSSRQSPVSHALHDYRMLTASSFTLKLIRDTLGEQSIDHEFLLLLAHAYGQQRPDLTQRHQQVNSILHRGGADGVGFLHGPKQLPDAVILPPQQAEHHSDQLGVLDERLLSPAGYGLRDQLLQVGWRNPIKLKSQRQATMEPGPTPKEEEAAAQCRSSPNRTLLF